jgi:hypothetical protein
MSVKSLIVQASGEARFGESGTLLGHINWRHHIRHNDTQHNDTQRNNTQHNDTQPNDNRNNGT